MGRKQRTRASRRRRWPTSICPTTGKLGFVSQVDAFIKANNASAHYGQRMRAYRCPDCRKWHTSRVKK